VVGPGFSLIRTSPGNQGSSLYRNGGFSDALAGHPVVVSAAVSRRVASHLRLGVAVGYLHLDGKEILYCHSHSCAQVYPEMSLHMIPATAFLESGWRVGGVETLGGAGVGVQTAKTVPASADEKYYRHTTHSTAFDLFAGLRIRVHRVAVRPQFEWRRFPSMYLVYRDVNRTVNVYEFGVHLELGG